MHSWVLSAAFPTHNINCCAWITSTSRIDKTMHKTIRANGFLIRKPTSKMLQLSTYMLSAWIVHSAGSDINGYEHKFFFLLNVNYFVENKAFKFDDEMYHLRGIHTSNAKLLPITIFFNMFCYSSSSHRNRWLCKKIITFKFNRNPIFIYYK